MFVQKHTNTNVKLNDTKVKVNVTNVMNVKVNDTNDTNVKVKVSKEKTSPVILIVLMINFQSSYFFDNLALYKCCANSAALFVAAAPQKPALWFGHRRDKDLAPKSPRAPIQAACVATPQKWQAEAEK